MRTLTWDYTGRAKAYVNRPDYADAAIDALHAIAKPGADAQVVDLGAGVGHLTIKLAERGLPVIALEPNPDMRAEGIGRTRGFDRVRWVDAVMEETGLAAASVSLATYGSSFGVTDRTQALDEAARVLADYGWFVCLFNHRDLEDTLQQQIERLIRRHVPNYDYGTRRQNQTPVIAAHGAFGPVHRLDCPVIRRVPAEAWLAAWQSHITLKHQAGAVFDTIISEIGTLLEALGEPVLEIPYITRVWMAARRPRDQ